MRFDAWSCGKLFDGIAYGALVKRKRGEKRLTQETLAGDVFGDSTRKGDISRIENGKITPQEATIQKINAALGISAAEMEPIRQARPIAEQLDRIPGLSLEDLQNLAARFGVDDTFDNTNADLLRRLLTEKAKEYRALRKEVDAIDESMKRLSNLKAAAQDAIARVDLEEVENLLLLVQATELEEAAKTAELRADNALLRGKVEDAYRILSAAADSFAGVDPLEPARRRDYYAIRLARHGERYGGTGLPMAADMFRAALTVTTREDHPVHWATTQQNLAIALRNQGSRTAGPEGAALLAEAIEAYRAALTVRTREDHPVQWATTQQNLANALRTQGARTAGPEGAALLAEAIGAYRAALTVTTRDDHPLQWATTHQNLGNALETQGSLLDGSEGDALLAEAVEAYRNALTVLTRADHPVEWAQTQQNLGFALAQLGAHSVGKNGAQLLQAAMDAYEAAIATTARDSHPVQWAETLLKMAMAEEVIADQPAASDTRRHLQASLDHVEAALSVFDPEHLSYDYVTATELRDHLKARLAELCPPPRRASGVRVVYGLCTGCAPPDPARSGPAEGLPHFLARLRRAAQVGEFGPLLERPRERPAEPFERPEIARNRRRNRLLDPVVPRDHRRIRPRQDRRRIARISRQTRPPLGLPGIERLRADKLIPRRRTTQSPERIGEIRLSLGHQPEEAVDQKLVLFLRTGQPQLRPEHRDPGLEEQLREPVHRLRRLFHRRLAVLAHHRQKRRRELRQVPDHHVRLPVIGIAPERIDRREHLPRLIPIHERARPIVDGLPRHPGIVGVHHPMDEAHAQPRRHQPRLRRDHRVEETERALGLRVMPRDHMGGQRLQRFHIPARREILERAHTDMARRDPGQHRAGQRALAQHRLAGGHCRQGPRRGNAQRMHRLRDQILSQHRPQPGPPVAHPRIGRRARALQLDVPPHAVPIHHLAQKQRPPVAQLRRPAAELVPGIDLRKRVGALGHTVPGQHFDTLGRSQRLGVDPQRPRQGQVQGNQGRRGDRLRRHPRVEPLGQAAIAVVERDREHHPKEVGPAHRKHQSPAPNRLPRAPAPC